MTCIKTGCSVFFENYGMTVRADLYSIGSCIIVRWTLGSQIWQSEDQAPTTADYTVKYWYNDEVWHREDLGVTVVPQVYFRKN